MKKTNALEMRRSLGKVLRELAEGGEPVLVEKDRKPTAVLISLRDYHERFVDRVAAEERRQIVEEILGSRPAPTSRAKRSVALIRGLRGRLP